MNVLVVDIGGTHVKFRTQKHTDVAKFDSGPDLTPQTMMRELLPMVSGWKFDHVTLGYPGFVVQNKIAMEPHNLGHGWVGFDFAAAFAGRPVRIMNDAALQALGSYQGGRMLFLGLGTGLGTAMVVDGVVQPMELAHLQWKKGKTYEDYLGKRGLKKRGKKKWLHDVMEVTETLKQALECDYIVLGGGNSKLVPKAEDFVHIGDNNNAFKGGFDVWKSTQSRTRSKSRLK